MLALRRTLQIVRMSASSNSSSSSSAMVDKTSVFVGNLPYNTTFYELACFFSKAGPLKRATVRGIYAYVQFRNEASATKALLLNGALLRKKRLNVQIKRINIPGMRTVRRVPPPPQFKWENPAFKK